MQLAGAFRRGKRGSAPDLDAGLLGRRAGRASLILTLGLCAACAPEARLPNLQAIYTRTAQASDDAALRTPLITVPGTLGTRLVDNASGTVIWGGGSRGISADPEVPEELRLLALPIPVADEPFRSLRDGVRPDGLLETAPVEILGIPLEVDVYGGALQTLQAGGFAEQRFRPGRDDNEVTPEASTKTPTRIGTAPTPSRPGATPGPNRTQQSQFAQYTFAYDWRRDLIETAHAFGRFLEARRADVAAERGVPPDQVKFDLLAHSMGALLTRYFLMYGYAEPDVNGDLPPITWSGARFFHRVVFVAPPNAGSILALDNLVNGKTLGLFQPFYPPALQSTHPSLYQLLPRPRHARLIRGGEVVTGLYDVDLWVANRWGLADPGADPILAQLMPDEADPIRRRARAHNYLGRLLNRARTFHRMMDRWRDPPAGLELFLVVGGGFETPSTGEVGPDGALSLTGVDEGDGVVLRASALLDERLDGNFTAGLRSPLRFKTTLFLPDEHVELTKNPVFGDNLLFWLLEAPRSRTNLAKPGGNDLLSAGTKVKEVITRVLPLPRAGRED